MTDSRFYLERRVIIGAATVDGRGYLSVTTVTYTPNGWERRDTRLLSPNAEAWLIEAVIHGATLAGCCGCGETVHESEMCAECGNCRDCCECAVDHSDPAWYDSDEDTDTAQYWRDLTALVA